MKTLQQNYRNPFYMNANVSIKPNWQGLMEFVNVSQENEIFKKNWRWLEFGQFRHSWRSYKIKLQWHIDIRHIKTWTNCWQ